MQHAPTRESATLIQSVQRAASILKAFDVVTPELGVNELGRKVNLHKSTVSRLLATLEHEGFVERVAGSEKYRLGLGVVRLAGHVTHFNDLRSVALPFLQDLAQQSQETVILAVLDGDEVINVEQVGSAHMVNETNWVGRRTPLNCVANGKALLAFQPRATIERMLQSPLIRYTDRTITNPEQLRSEIEDIRARGYATALGEIEAGLNSVAAPIHNAHGEVIAAVSISGPAYRVTDERIPALGAQAIETAHQIAQRVV
jgi:IclR family acetate operon transcriptional repressor